MTLLEELLALLGQLDLDIGPAFSPKMPATPDRCVVLARYGGAESRLADNYDEVRVQFRCRGPASDPRVAERDAETIYNALNGLAKIRLAGGTYLSLAVGLSGGPVYIGQDANKRDEYTANFRVEVSRTASHRENP
ncbi:minor capsid protein [Nonomuraea sp. NPDC050547]|uniref:minor capsid protein n=1 Tax=Nonomuraea sp. NPDC050547 TaxID=3364368 RepID=UPI0037A00D5E